MNKQKTWKAYVFWIALTEAAGVLAGILTREGTKAYSESILQPPLSPSSILFPIVWSVLYAIMGVAAARIWLARPSGARSRSLGLYLVQLGFNFFWSIIFFNRQAFGLAFFWLVALWALILAMIAAFRRVDPAAAWTQVPYLLWVTFAGYLNAGVWMLN